MKASYPCILFHKFLKNSVHDFTRLVLEYG